MRVFARPFLLSVVALLGCASSPSSSGTPADAAAEASVAMDAPAQDVAAEDATTTDGERPAEDAGAEDVPAFAGPYPEGPYGNREGQVLANLAWEGYVNPTGEEVSTALAFGPTSLQELRGDGRGYALIHLAEFL